MDKTQKMQLGLPIKIQDKELKNLNLPGATVELQRGFIPESFAELIFKELVQTIEWEQRDVVVYGKTYPQPRLTAWYGTESYTYSGMRMEPKPLTQLLQNLKDKVEAATHHKYNSVLLNRYVAGQNHGIGMHSDNEAELGRDPCIAMLTFGEGRALEFKPNPWIIKKHPETKNIFAETLDGSLLVMRGKTQSNWKHGLPKTRGLKDRITLTFRAIGS